MWNCAFVIRIVFLFSLGHYYQHYAVSLQTNYPHHMEHAIFCLPLPITDIATVAVIIVEDVSKLRLLMMFTALPQYPSNYGKCVLNETLHLMALNVIYLI